MGLTHFTMHLPYVDPIGTIFLKWFAYINYPIRSMTNRWIFRKPTVTYIKLGEIEGLL